MRLNDVINSSEFIFNLTIYLINSMDIVKSVLSIQINGDYLPQSDSYRIPFNYSISYIDSFNVNRECSVHGDGIFHQYVYGVYTKYIRDNKISGILDVCGGDGGCI